MPDDGDQLLSPELLSESRARKARPVSAGPIALVGSGEFLEVMDDVDRGLLDGRPPRAVFLPTAAGEEGPERVRYWLDLGRRHFERLGIQPVPLPVLTREDAENADLAALVAGAGLVYLSGGNPGYLARVLRDTAVWAAIVAAWQAGAALAGCSAGACALSYVADDVRAMRVAMAAARGDGAPPGLRSEPAGERGPSGLSLVGEVAVIPHFDRLSGRAPEYPARFSARLPENVTAIGIDEETAILTAPGASAVRPSERSFTVAGKRAAWLLDSAGGRMEYPPGSTFTVPSDSER